MITRTLYRSFRHLVIVFLLALTACTSTPVSQPVQQAPSQARSASDWLQLSNSAPAGQQAAYQLKAAQIYQQQGDITAAKNILRSVAREQLQGQAITDYLNLGASVIASESGAATAADWLQAGEQQALLQRGNAAQQAAGYAQLADLLDQSGQHLAAAELRTRISNSLDSEQARSANRDAIWISLTQAPASTLELGLKQSNPPLNPTLRGWYQLALLAMPLQGDIDQQLAAIERWQLNEPTHPAALNPPGDIELLQHLVANKPAQIAVLLPMQGALKDAGHAIRDGILSAYFDARARGASSSALVFYDTETNPDVAALYRQAVDAGAELIIGPLRKNRVDALLQFSDGLVPILALNYTSDDQDTGDNFYQLGLSIADEAEATARRAWTLDYHRAFIIHGTDSQSSRSAEAFQQAWHAGGGETVATVEFDSERTTSERIKQGLNIDRSLQRARTLESITGTSLEYNPRRRQDIDFVYLPVGSQQARSIKPLLAFHFAQDLPVYATSRVYRGKPDPRGDADLNGVYFTDTPWALGAVSRQHQQIEDYIKRGGAASKNLYALGIDAFQLAPRLPQMLYTPGLAFAGVTGTMRLTSKGALLRQPSWAVFRRGVATLLEQEEEHESMDANTTQNQVQQTRQQQDDNRPAL